PRGRSYGYPGMRGPLRTATSLTVPAPPIVVNAVVNAVVATATADTGTPAVQASSTVSPPAAAASAAAGIPTSQADASITAVAATAAARAPAPTYAISAVIYAVAAAALAEAPAPDVVAFSPAVLLSRVITDPENAPAEGYYRLELADRSGEPVSGRLDDAGA